MKISEEQAKEIKQSAENIYRLTKLILTETKNDTTYVTIPKGQEAIRYVQEVDRLERPQIYFHFQAGEYYAEIRRGKKEYYVRSNIKPKEHEMKEDTLIAIKRMGVYTIYEIKNEEFSETRENYLETVREILDKLRAIKDNEFLF